MSAIKKPTCRLFHDWGTWEDIRLMVRPTITNRWEGGPVLYDDRTFEQDAQKKICRRCGKKKVRHV